MKLNIIPDEELRKEVKDGTLLGKQVKRIMNQGILVPNELFSALLKARLQRSDCQNGFILDGFPRNKEQVTLLDEFIERPYYVLNLDEDIKVLLRRIIGRRVCERCGATFNVFTNKPKVF